MPRRTLVLALLAGALIAPSANASIDTGLNLGGNFFADPVSYSAVQSSGTQWARVFVYLDQLTPGVMAEYRASFDRFNAQGTKVEAVMLGVADSTLREDPRAYTARATGFAALAGPGLKAVEVWNEEDAPAFWAGGADAPAYARMLKNAYPALKAVRPDISVLVGGLTGSNSAYLTALLAEDVGGSFDAVGVHSDTACNLNSPYVTQKDNAGILTFSSFLGYKELLKALAKAGITTKIWFTELGWSTSKAVCDQGAFAGQKDGGVSESDQALFLRQAYHCLNADSANVGPSFWFNLRDAGADTPDGRFGLLRPDNSPKPAFGAFSSVTKNGDGLGDEGCGKLDGPSITVTELGDPKVKNKLTFVYGNQLHLRGLATDPDGVGRVSVYVDGRKIRNFTEPKGANPLGFCMNIDSAKKLKKGLHVVRLEAKSGKSGNSSTQSFPVTKVTKTKANKKAPSC